MAARAGRYTPKTVVCKDQIGCDGALIKPGSERCEACARARRVRARGLTTDARHWSVRSGK